MNMYYEQRQSFWLIGHPDEEVNKLVDTQEVHPGAYTASDAFWMGQGIILPVFLWVVSGVIGYCVHNAAVGWGLGMALTLLCWSAFPYYILKERRDIRRWQQKLDHPRFIWLGSLRMDVMYSALCDTDISFAEVSREPHKLLVDTFFVSTELLEYERENAIEDDRLSEAQEKYHAIQNAAQRVAAEIVAYQSAQTVGG